ncbi:Serine/threonine-protein kinase haspin [Labeo rohita]|uniref:Serine/threonine-protein kinase haspin n=1 Tax=Labeo rohita TaxID=84645 RepID=A0ABQ8L3J9_LABRO|nr:Serine/threonine-protein kinase haspin [Labeo rohita]
MQKLCKKYTFNKRDSTNWRVNGNSRKLRCWQKSSKRRQLQQLQADNEVKVAAARVRVYNNFDGLESFEEETDHKTQYGWQDAGLRTLLNPQAMPFQPHPAPSKAPVTQEEVSLSQAIASSLTLSRLPVPTTFTGDLLKFIDWKISSWLSLTRSPSQLVKKYLKIYLAGEACKAVEGFFYLNSEKAYQGAWAVLQDRYGSPFIVQKAFRDKLMKWPKIAANDSIALRVYRFPSRLC